MVFDDILANVSHTYLWIEMVGLDMACVQMLGTQKRRPKTFLTFGLIEYTFNATTTKANSRHSFEVVLVWMFKQTQIAELRGGGAAAMTAVPTR